MMEDIITERIKYFDINDPENNLAYDNNGNYLYEDQLNELKILLPFAKQQDELLKDANILLLRCENIFDDDLKYKEKYLNNDIKQFLSKMETIKRTN
jgi:hypothetical protein